MPILESFDRYLNLREQWTEMFPHQRESHLPAIDRRIALYGGRYNHWTRAHLFTTAQEVLSHLRERLEEQEADGAPFFGLLNLTEPHDPYYQTPTSIRILHTRSRDSIRTYAAAPSPPS